MLLCILLGGVMIMKIKWFKISFVCLLIVSLIYGQYFTLSFKNSSIAFATNNNLTALDDETAADVPINKENFPDDVFRNYVKNEIIGDSNATVLTGETRQKVTVIEVPNMGISSLKGVEYFFFLSTLICSDNNLTELNVSRNFGLSTLKCQNNQIMELDLSNQTNMNTLYCQNNKLNSLNFASSHPHLFDVNCCNNRIKTLDLHDSRLFKLYCSNNELTELNITNCGNLYAIECNHNRLEEIVGFSTCMPYEINCSENRFKVLSLERYVGKEPHYYERDDVYFYITALDRFSAHTCTSDVTPVVTESHFLIDLKEIVGPENYKNISDIYLNVGHIDKENGVIAIDKSVDLTQVYLSYDYLPAGDSQYMHIAYGELMTPVLSVRLNILAP